MHSRDKIVFVRDLVERLRSRHASTTDRLVRLRADGDEDAPVASALLPLVDRLFYTLAHGARDAGVVLEMSLAPQGSERLDIDFRVLAIEDGRPHSAAERTASTMSAISKNLLKSGFDPQVCHKANTYIGQVSVELEDGATEPRIPRRKRYP